MKRRDRADKKPPETVATRLEGSSADYFDMDYDTSHLGFSRTCNTCGASDPSRVFEDIDGRVRIGWKCECGNGEAYVAYVETPLPSLTGPEHQPYVEVVTEMGGGVKPPNAGEVGG